MVSHSDHHHSSSLTLRGPSTVIGAASGGGGTSGGERHGGVDRDRYGDRYRSSTSRSRRYNRSHAGGMSYVPQNEFPIFGHSGDVEIVVRVRSGHENRYLLHRHTLTRFSGFFEASTSNEWSRAQHVPALPSPTPASTTTAPPTGSGGAASLAVAQGTELARIGEDVANDSERQQGQAQAQGKGQGQGLDQGQPLMKKRWRYELDCGTGDNDIPMLVQKEESSPTIPRSGGGGSSSGSNNMGPANSIFGGGYSSSSSSRTKPLPSSTSQHGNRGSFFRSVANLSLSHHGHHHDGYTNSSAPQPLPPPTQAEQDLLRDYDNLFRIMYNYPPLLDGINIADAYVQCKSLLALADQYDALAVVGPRVDHHLLQFQSRLWRQIAKYPISYLRLAYLARSRIIFQEALIHVVGQWPAGERSLRAALPDAVMDLIEDKVDELEEAVSRVEARLFRLNLTTRAGERVTPATAYLDWLAVSLFRQWLADNTTPPPPPLPPGPPQIPDRRANGGGRSSSSSHEGSSSSSGGRSRGPAAPIRHHHSNSMSSGHHHHSHHRLAAASAVSASTALPPPLPPLASLGRPYRTLGSPSPSAYLTHDECKRFLKLSGELYSRDNLRRFEKRVDELKAMAREIVRPLMGSGLELDLGSSPGGGSGSGPGVASSNGHKADGGGGGVGGAVPATVNYLTCTRVGDRDLPWSVE